jgi:hypothetical protein
VGKLTQGRLISARRRAMILTQAKETMFKTDGKNTYNVGLRLRVTSNNGINAFLGLSKANKSSQVVVKLQQDDVKNLVQKTNSQVYDY